MSDVRTILIVDDEADAIEFVKAALGEIGEFNTPSATDGAKGLKKAKETKPDLIILDLQMPVRDGVAMFMDLKKEESTKDIPVIMLTGVAEKVGIRFSGKDMGQFVGNEPQAYIEKPVDPAQLQMTVSRLLGL